jgi:hypothetical protein
MFKCITALLAIHVTPSMAVPVASQQKNDDLTSGLRQFQQRGHWNIFRPANACSFDADCGASEVCLSQHCTTTDGYHELAHAETDCSSHSDCPTGEFCLFELCTSESTDSSKSTVRAKTECSSHSDCPAGDFCLFELCTTDATASSETNAISSADRECAVDDECTPGDLCIFGMCINTDDTESVSAAHFGYGCSDDAECSGDTVCNADGACIAVSSRHFAGCRHNAECHYNEFCSAFGLCIANTGIALYPSCTSNMDCAKATEICVFGMCIAGSQCSTNADCLGHAICNQRGVCQTVKTKRIDHTKIALAHPMCFEDADCHSGEVCSALPDLFESSGMCTRNMPVFAAQEVSKYKTLQQQHGDTYKDEWIHSNRVEPPSSPLSKAAMCEADSNCPAGQYCAAMDIVLFGVWTKQKRCVYAYARSKPTPAKAPRAGGHPFSAAAKKSNGLPFFVWKIGNFPPCPFNCGTAASVVAQTLSCQADARPWTSVDNSFCKWDTVPSLLWKTCDATSACM